MNISVSLRRIPLMMALALLVVCGLAPPLPAADTASFAFTGKLQKVGRDGKYALFAWEGRASHLGSCIGMARAWVRSDDKRDGFLTLMNDREESIDFYMQWIRDPDTGESIGVFEIIGGTGRFADVTGSGSLHVFPGGAVTLDGIISY